jgi:hypothetical protein
MLFAEDAFQAHGAGALVNLGAVSLQVLGVQDAVGGAGQQLGEHALALDKPRPAQIEPVEVQEVEDVVEQPVLAASSEIGMQQPEIGDPARVRDDGFAVQDQVVRPQGGEGIGDLLKAPRPIVAPPGVDGGSPLSQLRLRAVTVELDLVEPPRAGWSLVAPGNGVPLAPGSARASRRAGLRCAAARLTARLPG